MMFDFHTHHSRCGHAEGSIEDYILAAVRNGLSMVGISDHSPFFAHEEDHPKPGIAMAKSEFGNYVKEVLSLKEKYRDQIEVLLGVESDFLPQHIELYRQIYHQYPMDYVIGSVHESNGVHVFEKNRWEGATEEDLLREKEHYYDLIERSARSGVFQILGHIDALKGYNPAISDVKTPRVDQALKVIAESDVAIEVNTSGKHKACGGWYPSNEILERAHFYGVKITLGSDSHTPERVGDEWEAVRDHLKKLGYKEWAVFRQRERYMVPL